MSITDLPDIYYYPVIYLLSASSHYCFISFIFLYPGLNFLCGGLFFSSGFTLIAFGWGVLLNTHTQANKLT